MKGGKLIKALFTVALSAIVFSLLIFLLIKLAPVPPVDDIKSAIASLSDASSRQASTYARKLYNEAEAAYDSAMANWKRENKKFIYFRNYEKTVAYARLAEKKAREASNSSVKNSNDLNSRLKTKINALKNRSSDIERIFGRYPLENADRSRLSKGNILLKEAEIAFEKKQLLSANRKLNDAGDLLDLVFDNAMSDIKAYFGSYPAWKKWFESSVAESRNHKNYLILVDKYAHKCYLYLSGIKKYEFDAELGKNWVGDKKIMGDKVTPEGLYKVTGKHQGAETQYYKSLGINYPNNDDVERFRKEIASGSLPRSAKIGSGIEIHGGGGKGVDWTDGCVALENKDMDILFRLVPPGTPVIIVGSLKSLDDITR